MKKLRLFSVMLLSIALTFMLSACGGSSGDTGTTHTPGTLDTTFGTDGTVTTDITGSGSDEYVYALAIQADGKVVAAGESWSTSDEFVLARYNTDGTLDTSFGTAGTVTTDISGSGNNSYAEAVAIQSDGKIVAAGKSYNGHDNNFALARYNTDGTLDASFGTAGAVTTDVSASSVGDHAYALAIQSDGKIVVAGEIQNNYFALARYNTNGTLDTSFGTAGTVTTDISSSYDEAYAVAIQPADGKIVAAGVSDAGIENNFALARYNADGVLDTSFGTGGVVTTDVAGSSSDDKSYAVAIQSDGKIVAAGYADGAGDDFALVRYNADGILDTTFGTAHTGIVKTDISGSGSGDYAYALAIQADGKIVVAGATYDTDDDFALARYNTDGTLDTTFGTGGTVTTDILGPEDVAYAVAIQSNGGIVTGGYSYNGSDYDFAIARYWP